MTEPNTRPGYKQTELGWIPEDWVVKKISDFSRPVRGGSPRPAGSPRFFNGDFIPWLTVASLTNISENQIIVNQTESFLTEEGSKFSRILEPGTVIIANSGATLGVSKILGIKCCANDGIAALLDVTGTCKEFLVFSINSIIKILRESIATGNGQPNLNTGLIGNLKFRFPPLPEQQAIAMALRDMDAYIRSLEQLIEKKKAIKQAAMQELLTPKEDWEVREFGEICSPSKSKLNPISSESTPCIELEDVSQNSGRLIGISDSKDKVSLKTVFKKGDVLLGKLRPYLRKYFNADFDGVCSTEIWALKANSGIDSKFLFYQVQSDRIIEAANLSTGTKMPRAEWKTVSKTMVHVPPIAEQKEIASILGTLDSSIFSLEKLLEKNGAIKQAMMQDLLTGKVRLV